MLPALLLALVQQPAAAYASPPSGDTIGYWQQRADYTIVATLDEERELLDASATLVYVNGSPDTLDELYVHQYLNAFRPGSRWSEDDEREGRDRFQRLPERAQAFERFTSTPTFDGTPVAPEYPGAPDSTVARFRLPRPLAPGDSVIVRFEWEARPSLLPRRQGRRGRSWDFAQWYPRVAVYDRMGWQANALRPAGEFYGEFGTFDVTLVLRDDQVLGTTGVVIEGDPGWRDALRWGVVADASDAYTPPPPPPSDTARRDSVPSRRAMPAAAGAPATTASTDRRSAAVRAADARSGATRVVAVPPDHKSVRVIARDVHHFGWSVSPDYIYEGAYYLRPDSARAVRTPVWDSVAVHVLYRPGDEATWGTGQVVARTTSAIRWLEESYGPYAYPQMTVLHRIEGGGTEFPMMQMNGSPSQGLILHEGTHIWAHGMLANNEWRAGWMDEGMASYQTAWAQGMTAPERALRPRGERPTRPGYLGRALTPRPEFGAAMQQDGLELAGRAQPLSTVAHEFSEFAVYNAMTYGRGEMLFAALRDAIGDEAFRRFHQVYYDRWVMRHVDVVAMQAAAEAASGRSLDWFFEQWVERTGVTDYALRDVSVAREGDRWVTTARVRRQGDYLHPMPLGVRVDSGWVIERGDVFAREQVITVRTATEPIEVRLDPHGTSPDWYAPNDQDVGLRRLNGRTTRFVFDWPFLEQSLGSRYVTALAPVAWYTQPGGLTVGGRMRSNYQGAYDRRELGLAVSVRNEVSRTTPEPPSPGTADPIPVEMPEARSDWSRLHAWYAFENPMLPGAGRPLMGWSGGAWMLDGMAMARLGREWDTSPYLASGPRVSHTLVATGTYPLDRLAMDGARWSGRSVTDLTWRYARLAPASSGTAFRMSVGGGVATGGPLDQGTDGFVRADLAWSVRRLTARGRLAHGLRLFAAGALEAPRERGLYLSARTPTETFTNHLYRGAGALLAGEDVPYVPLGGLGLRGFDPLVPARAALAVNLEEGVRVRRFAPGGRPLDLFATAFVDGALVVDEIPDVEGERRSRGLADAGVGLLLRGRLFDRDVSWRVDLPLYVSDPAYAVGERWRDEPSERVALRWTFSSGDLW